MYCYDFCKTVVHYIGLCLYDISYAYFLLLHFPYWLSRYLEIHRRDTLFAILIMISMCEKNDFSFVYACEKNG
jgi:hypothetical protein